MPIGPVTCIPASLLRADVLLLVGEDPAECMVGGQTEWAHSYRGFHAAVIDDRLHVVTPFGSSAMEAVLWELLRAEVPRRVLIAGTAGALDGYTGHAMRPLQVSSARPVYQCFDAHPEATFEPSWMLELPEVASVSTDRFYGMSPTIEDDYPADAGMSEAWQRYGATDAIVEMEVAACYHFCKQFGDAELQYSAIKVVANDVSELESLPESSRAAMALAIQAALTAFTEGR